VPALRGVLTWLATQLAVGPVVLVLFVLNRTRIYGRSRIPRRTGTMLLSNHLTMIDSFLLVFAAYFPREILRLSQLPWHPAAEENFFKNGFYRFVFETLRCIPVRRGRRDLRAITRSVRVLRDGNLIVFPEGTRSRDGTIGKGRAGAGLILLETGATAIPVTITGMDRVLPVGSRFPRFGHRVTVYFGRPVRYDDLLGEERSREAAQRLIDRVMARIRFQRRVIERIDRRRHRP